MNRIAKSLKTGYFRNITKTGIAERKALFCPKYPLCTIDNLPYLNATRKMQKTEFSIF